MQHSTILHLLPVVLSSSHCSEEAPPTHQVDSGRSPHRVAWCSLGVSWLMSPTETQIHYNYLQSRSCAKSMMCKLYLGWYGSLALEFSANTPISTNFTCFWIPIASEFFLETVCTANLSVIVEMYVIEIRCNNSAQRRWNFTCTGTFWLKKLQDRSLWNTLPLSFSWNALCWSLCHTVALFPHFPMLIWGLHHILYGATTTCFEGVCIRL